MAQRFQTHTVDDLWNSLDATGPCWLFIGDQKPNPVSGYVQLSWKCLPEPTLHHTVWRLLVGEIPEGLQLDHLCQVRTCANTDHLEPVTPLVNTRRRGSHGHCKKGHLITPENSTSNGRTVLCKRCRRQYRARRRAQGHA